MLGIGFISLFVYGIRPYVVESGSMEPTIQTGSVCFINQRYAYDHIKQNDIIAFKLNSGKLVIHRTISIIENGLQTKGDANKVQDDIITNKDNFIGKNIFCISHVGCLVKKLQTNKGKTMFATTILVILVLVFFFEDNNKSKIIT